jgi:O-antigen/teichoic acid export membrane protein
MVRLVAPAELGLYAIAATGAMLIAPLAQGVGFSLFPYLRREPDALRRRERTQAALAWVWRGSVLGSLAIAALAPIGLPLLMGEEFGAAVSSFLLLLPGQVCWNVAQVHKVVLEAGGRPGAASASLAAAAVFTVAAVPPAVRVAGIEGAAVVTSASQVLFLATVAWQARRLNTGGLEVGDGTAVQAEVPR